MAPPTGRVTPARWAAPSCGFCAPSRSVAPPPWAATPTPAMRAAIPASRITAAVIGTVRCPPGRAERSEANCQALARAEWLEARKADLLPVPYFHVVFTLPEPVAAIALQNQR